MSAPLAWLAIMALFLAGVSAGWIMRGREDRERWEAFHRYQRELQRQARTRHLP